MKKIFILSSLIAVTLATTSFAEPTELDKKTVASKAYVDTKQDIIETGLVSLGDDWFENLPSVVSFDSTSGLIGNKYGILDLNGSMDYIDDGWQNYVGDSEVEYLIPTVGAVGRELQNVWHLLVFFNWYDAMFPAANTYSTTFNPTLTHVDGNWPYNHQNYLINGTTFVNSLAIKQNKIAKSGYYYALNGTLTAYGNNSNTNGWLNAGVKGTGLVTKTATDGVVGERKIFEATDVANYHSTGSTQFQQDIQDISIPTVGAMMGMISNAVNTLTWTATETTATQKYSTTFDGTANNWPTADANKIIDGTALANGLAQKQNKMTCAGWDSETHTDEHCWLWSIE